ncbi:hypothetical protein ZWY2020_058453 [Hordeum vulgare]|nr:hypothetical protein ZWY2020_058453 [Hordeum vulgare]
MLVLVHFALTPMLVLVRVLCVLTGALSCLFFAPAWVTSAASAAQVVADRAWGEGSAPFLFLQELMYGAFKVCVYSFLVFLALVVLLEAAKKHHHLDLNTLGGHTDCITVLDFSSDACNLATGDPLLKEKASYFTNAEKLKFGYTSRTRIRRAIAREGI